MEDHFTHPCEQFPRVPRVDDRRFLNGIFWMLRSVAPCYVLNGEAFRGQDRIELIDDALTSGQAPYAA